MREEFILNNIVYKQTIFQGYYITNNGEIAQISFTESGKLKSFFLMRQEKTKAGYLRVQIGNKHYLIHRLVYQTWSENKLDNYLVIDHIDSNPQNNNITNLRQVSQKENVENARQHGNFGHSHDTKISVYNSETDETKEYLSVKDFLIDINAPEYILKHGGLSGLKKRKEYNKYTWRKIDEH